MPGSIASQDLAAIEGRDDAVLTQLCGNIVRRHDTSETDH
jgi:hypothetical protein